MPGFTHINLTLPDEIVERINARAGTIEKSKGRRSYTIAEDLRTFYDLTDRAKRTVCSLLEPEELALCKASLQATFIEPSLIPYLRQEIEEGLEQPNKPLMGKLNQLGILELYALAQLIKGSTR